MDSTHSDTVEGMAYRRGRRSIRDAYEECFPATDAREVTVHRVVNIFEKRSPMPRPGMEYERGFNDDQWHGGPRNYQDGRDFREEDGYPPSDRRYFDDNPSFRRNSPPPRNEGPYSQQCYGRDDLRHQIGSRSSGRSRPYFRSRGRGSGPPLRDERDDYRNSPPIVVKRDRSPGSREAQPPVRSGSNSRNRSLSPDRDKGYTHQQGQKKHKPNVLPSHTPSSTVEGSHSSGSSKEKTPASVAETEEVVAASMEPKLTPEEDFKTRRLEAIKAKALEIEKHYRQDCETFRTVVKMLVDKDPSLDNLLQAPLDQNLSEIKQRCLDALRHFVKELDETITRGGNGPDHGSLHTSSTTLVWPKEDFPQPCPTNPTDTDRKQDGRMQPGNTGVSVPVPAGNQGGEGEKQTGNTEESTSAPAGNQGGGGKQTGNAEDSTVVPEIYGPGLQENLATPEPEDNYFDSKSIVSKSPATPAQQSLVEGPPKRLQLYNHKAEKFSHSQLSNPKIWQDITYARPGWVPHHQPYFQPGKRYWELKANSTVVSASKPLSGKGHRKKVACGVTSYMHFEGPWCEIQSPTGTRICILAAPPPTPRIPPLIGQGPLEQNAREDVWRGPRPRVHPACVPYPSMQKGNQA